MRAQALPAYVYNMWVYGTRKQSSQDPLGDFLINFDYDVDYKPSALVRTQQGKFALSGALFACKWGWMG